MKPSTTLLVIPFSVKTLAAPAANLVERQLGDQPLPVVRGNDG